MCCDASSITTCAVVEISGLVTEDSCGKKDDCNHINVAELETLLKGVNVALKWGIKRDKSKDWHSHSSKFGELYCGGEQKNRDKRCGWRNDDKVETSEHSNHLADVQFWTLRVG